MSTRVFILNGTTSWANPGDWISAGSKIECVGTGGTVTQSIPGGATAPGAGGGAYAFANNVNITNWPVTVGVVSGNGNLTQFGGNGSSSAGSTFCSAQNGESITSTSGVASLMPGSGGQYTWPSTGVDQIAGGNGGAMNWNSGAGGGGGGAGGPSGWGINGGTSPGDPGGAGGWANGGVGAIGGAANAQGASGTEWGLYGCGGGGGGGNSSGATFGGHGGSRGGGAGGVGWFNTNSAVQNFGLIVVTYTPSPPPPPPWNLFDTPPTTQNNVASSYGFVFLSSVAAFVIEHRVWVPRSHSVSFFIWDMDNTAAAIATATGSGGPGWISAAQHPALPIQANKGYLAGWWTNTPEDPASSFTNISLPRNRPPLTLVRTTYTHRGWAPLWDTPGWYGNDIVVTNELPPSAGGSATIIG